MTRSGLSVSAFSSMANWPSVPLLRAICAGSITIILFLPFVFFLEMSWPLHLARAACITFERIVRYMDGSVSWGNVEDKPSPGVMLSTEDCLFDIPQQFPQKKVIFDNSQISRMATAAENPQHFKTSDAKCHLKLHLHNPNNFKNNLIFSKYRCRCRPVYHEKFTPLETWKMSGL